MEELFGIEDFDEKLSEQITLLLEWNKKNINEQPEQVRKNIKTILRISDSHGTSTYTINNSVRNFSKKEPSLPQIATEYKGLDI